MSRAKRKPPASPPRCKHCPKAPVAIVQVHYLPPASATALSTALCQSHLHEISIPLFAARKGTI